MGLLTISGEPASRFEEVAHGAAQLLRYELVAERRIEQLVAEEFGQTQIPDHAWRAAAASILARLATRHRLVVACEGAESLFPALPGLLRVGVIAPDARRVGNVLVDRLQERSLERAEAAAELARMDTESRRRHKARFGRTAALPGSFDLVLNAEQMDAGQMAEVVRAAAAARCLTEMEFLPPEAEAKLQFQTRLELSRHGIVPARPADLKRTVFGHPSEEVFANLLDFYRIQWQYEPRSFPLQWDKDGGVIEAFTPDFYLPEFDLYVELTTMKQTLVTRKNHKIKLLRAVYPHINIQVFYQKDFQDLVFKYGLRVSGA